MQLELAGAAVAALRKNEQVRALGLSFTDPFGEDVSVQLLQLLDKLIAAPEPAGRGQTLVSLASEDIILPAARDSTRALFACGRSRASRRFRGVGGERKKAQV